MKSPVVFRAEFIQPIGALNPGRIKMSAPVEVEVFHAKVSPATWAARRPGKRVLFDKITPQSTAAQLMKQIELLYFERKFCDWRPFDSNQEPPRLLKEGEWGTDSKGGVFLTEYYREILKEENGRKNVVTK
jgi:hypothetical protein